MGLINFANMFSLAWEEGAKLENGTGCLCGRRTWLESVCWLFVSQRNISDAS